jgi:hypothetical protein
MELAPFYFAHPECILLPVEHLGDTGISGELAAELRARKLFGDTSIELFDAALVRLFARGRALADAAPDTHLPPRVMNVCVVTAPQTTRPYFQPFVDESVLIYASDLDPATSSVEHAAFQMLFAERLGQLRRFGLALLASIPFLLAMTDEEASDFMRGAARSTRPDAEVARSLGELLPAMRKSMLAEGAGLSGDPPPGYGRLRGTALAATREIAPDLSRLTAAAEACASRVASAYLARQAQRDPCGEPPEDVVVRRLEREAPRVLVTDASGQILWDPERPSDTARLREAIDGVGTLPARSLAEDLATVGDATRRFLAILRDPDALVVPTASLEEAGGVYVHHDRRLIAYALVQPGLDATREAAPPYHRLLVAARVVHEWGHLAVDGGVVPVSPGRHRDFERAGAELRALYGRIIETAPASAREALDAELAELRAEGTRLEELPFSRMEDYRSNLLARRVLRTEELEAYIRANIRSLLAEPIGLLRKLSRYAYEAQYLWLSKMADPWSYLVKSTYFREEYVDPEIVSEPAARELVRVVGELCGCYAVDESKLVDRGDA